MLGAPGENTGTRLCYGDYFSALVALVRKERFGLLARAASRMLGRSVEPAQIRSVAIYLEKHGALYHPSRIRVDLGGSRFDFAANVAVTPHARGLLRRECAILRRLGRRFPGGPVPEIYGYRTVSAPSGAHLVVSLGLWFQGFYEFHLSRDPHDRTQRVMLWDTDRGVRILDPGQALDVYRQVARILTGYYDIRTFEQVSSWHHAAGDFVVQPTGPDRVDVRLITVRRYAPLMCSLGTDAATAVNALVLFWVNLSLRNRLDRLDGTGDAAWAEPGTVYATLTGVFQALDAKAAAGEVPPDFPGLFRDYLQRFSEAELLSLTAAVADRHPGPPAEIRLIRGAVRAHAAEMHRVLGIQGHDRRP